MLPRRGMVRVDARGAHLHVHRRTSSTRMLTLEDEVDEAAMLAASTFPIQPEVLINRCKEVILEQRKIQDGSIDESIYSDDFRFCAPFVGGPTPTSPTDPMPGLSKSEYLNALRNFDLLTAFPDMNNNYHGFYVDPFEPNRVWFRTRVFATHTGPLLGGQPTGKKLELPPQSFSMTFNEKGQVTLFNVGYVLDRTVGNTGGLGGAFGFFWATGNVRHAEHGRPSCICICMQNDCCRGWPLVRDAGLAISGMSALQGLSAAQKPRSVAKASKDAPLTLSLQCKWF